MPVIVGPGHEAAGAGDRGHVRAADSDRDEAIDVLKAAFTQGRLTKDELDERVALALRALTYADLDALTNDIPRQLVAASPARPAQETINAPAGANIKPRDGAIVATATLTGVVFVIAFLLNDGALSALLALVAMASGLVSLTQVASDLRDTRRANRQGGQPPAARGLDPGPGADLQAVPGTEQHPSARPGPQGTTDTARIHRPRPQPAFGA